MHVLIATDGSPLSIEAARRGCDLLGQPAKVTLLAVLDEVPGEDAGGFESSVYTVEQQQALWQQEQWRAASQMAHTAAALHGARIDQRVEVGDVAHAIVRVASEVGADVIVVGSHGHSGVKRFLLGSVSEHVVRHAPCPVLVVHGASED